MRLALVVLFVVGAAVAGAMIAGCGSATQIPVITQPVHISPTIHITDGGSCDVCRIWVDLGEVLARGSAENTTTTDVEVSPDVDVDLGDE